MSGLVLASRSPRRRRLLAALGYRFAVDAAAGDGPPARGGPRARVLGHARHKAREVAARRPGDWILAGDTLVCLGGELLAKPAGRDEARRMLERLSGAEHAVWTGLCAVDPRGRCHERAEEARVRFRVLGEEELARYLDGDEWRDKAGAYAIQGAAGAWGTVVRGDPDTVVGLPARPVVELLAAAGLPRPRARG